MDKLKRINKYISESGFCSRRAADDLVTSGRVFVNGKVAEIGTKISYADSVLVDGKPIDTNVKKIYLAFNKPVLVTCTTDSRDPDNIIDFIGYKERIFPIGRLDKMSEGLIFLTNDGDIVNKILRSENENKKEYIVKVDLEVTEGFLSKMSSGVNILDIVTKKCEVYKIGKYEFGIILTQGVNRQIRRMCETLGYKVKKLKRIRIMDIELGNLGIGKLRVLSDSEVKGLIDNS
jgi:23S rRNA pseudouridine2604 synthase